MQQPKGRAPDWRSFWDLATPEETAQVFVDLYGKGARQAVEECIRSAADDGRYEDRRFWRAVTAILDALDVSEPDGMPDD